jgi:dTDP-4-amino-4,6-dideoxygalactose transaminase
MIKIPFGTILINDKSRKLINEILDSNKISCGKYVRLFEEEFARIIGTKHAVALSSGTDADTLALAVLHDFGAKRGDEVIVPALSFVATGNAVLHAGFKPVFVDIERSTLNIDCSKIEKAITKRTRAIMPVHLMGKPADMDAINAIAKKHNLYVIEDAAEAHGAFYKGKPVGTLADMAAFSLYVAHIVSTGEGGIVLTERSDFAEILRSLRSHGRACKCKSCLLNTNDSYCKKRWVHGKDIRFVSERIGYSSKMNELEAAIGLGALAVYDKILEKRRHNLLLMKEKFQRFLPLLATINEESHEKIGPHGFAIIVSEDAPFSRDDLASYLEKNGIDTRDLFSSIPTQCQGFSFLGYTIGDFPHAEFIGTHGLHIGVHQGISDKHIDYFITLIDTFLRKNH